MRATWPEVLELIAAAHVHTVAAYGPDRTAGFTVIPAMSMTSYAAGTRFYSLLGGTIPSFYDWYADLPIASPQVFGDQTDVPESADWWNASYLIVWGTNLPITRTPDAHFMTEARYRGQKVVVVSPDYSDHTKFADDWLPAAPGTDAALAMAMGHVMLTEFYRDRQVPRFESYARTYTDLPFLVSLRRREDAWVPDHFVTAADLGRRGARARHGRPWSSTKRAVRRPCRTGRSAFGGPTRASDAGTCASTISVPLSACTGRAGAEALAVDLPRFDVGDGEGGGVLRRGVPAIQLGERWVTTVFDLVMAQYGVARDGLPGEWPTGYDDATVPYTPAWQERITSVPAAACARVAREFARNAEVSDGRSMIAMGAGTNHWYHSDQIYRTFLSLLMLGGCEGVNGGGWAHYVGQEKVRPADRLVHPRLRLRLGPAHPAHARHPLLVPGQRSVALRGGPGRPALEPARRGPFRRSLGGRPQRLFGPPRVAGLPSDLRPQPTGSRRPSRGGRQGCWRLRRRRAHGRAVALCRQRP